MSTNVRQLFDLEGRTALVTGGSRGLGLQMAEALGEAGARVLLTSRKPQDLEESAAHLAKRGIQALWNAADLSQPGEIVRVAEDAIARLATSIFSSTTPARRGVRRPRTIRSRRGTR